MPSAPDEVLAVSARAAASYDAMPYDPVEEGFAFLDPEPIFGLAGLHGDFPLSATLDALDLGCGAGSQVLRLGGKTQGRVVGVDISPAACARARERCAGLGGRARILCRDFLSLTPDELGTFDQIILNGVLYVVPHEVQTHLLSLVAACLKPGGVVVISYYAMIVADAVMRLRSALRPAVDMAAPPGEQIGQARARLRAFAAGISPHDQAMAVVAGHAASCPDSTFFHEMLDETFIPFTTSDLERALAPGDVHFLNWLSPGDFGHVAAAKDRAAAADALNAARGAYHYAVFGKAAADRGALGDWRGVRWHTALRRTGGNRFSEPANGRWIDLPPRAAAAADLLADGPKSWADLKANPAATQGEFLALWYNGLAAPLGIMS